MIRGVCYFLCGRWTRYIGTLCVSLHSLRKHYIGPVIICLADNLTDERLSEITLALSRDTDCTIHPVAMAAVRHSQFVTKSQLWRMVPFDECILIDADTICVGPIDELFGHPLTVVQFSNWNTQGRKIGGRLRQWERIPEASGLLAKCLSHPYPHVNTGVVAWNRSCPLLPEWERLSILGCACSWTDEYAMQLLISGRDDVRILDDRYNCSPTYGKHLDDARILHFHGRRYIPGRNHPEAAAMYRPHLLAAIEDNVGGIRDWLPELDPALADLAKRSPAAAV